MGGYCGRCGREAELLPAPDGSLYCNDCILQAASPRCIDCIKCYQRRCGDAIYACPFCSGTPENYTPETFQRKLKEERMVAPLRVEEKCERCGGTLAGRAFVLHGKALCRDCLLYEQERWEIVSGKPGKHGSRVKIVIEKPGAPRTEEALQDERRGRKLLSSLGVDPDNPPPDPFASMGPISEKPMPKDSCKNCEAYRRGKMRKSSGAPKSGRGK